MTLKCLFRANIVLVKILSEKPTQRKWKKDEEEETQLDADDLLFESKFLAP